MSNEILIQIMHIDWLSIALIVVCLLLSTLVIWKFVYIPIQKVLNQRENNLHMALCREMEANQRLQKAQEQAEFILKQARFEADKLVEETKNRLKPQEENMLIEIEMQKTKILEAATIHAQDIIRQSIEQAHREAGEYSKQVLKDMTSKALQRIRITDTQAQTLFATLIDSI